MAQIRVVGGAEERPEVADRSIGNISSTIALNAGAPGVSARTTSFWV